MEKQDCSLPLCVREQRTEITTGSTGGGWSVAAVRAEACAEVDL